MPRLIMTESARDTVTRLLLAALVLALFALAGMRVLSDPGFLAVFRNLEHTNPAWMAAIAALYLLSSFLNAELTRVVINRLQYRVTMGQAFAAFMVRIYGNLLFAKAGIGMSAAFMRVRYGVRIPDYASMLVGVTVLQFFCIGLSGLTGQLLLRVFNGIPLDCLIAAVFAVCVVGGGTCLMAPFRLFRFLPASISGFLARVETGIGQIRSGSRETETGILTLLTLQCAAIGLRAVRLWLVFASVGAKVNPAGLFVASLLGDIGQLVGVTPMGIGFREAAIGYGARLVGVAAPAAVAVTLADRAIWSLTTLVATQVLLRGWFSRRSRSLPAGDQEQSVPLNRRAP